MARLDPVPVSTVLLSLVAVLALTAGCLAVPAADETPSAAELEAEIDAAEPPQMASATLESTHVTDDGTATYEEEIWMHADGRTAVETTTGDGARHTNVDDGEYAWFYDHEADRVTVLDSERTGESHFDYLYDEQRRYFEELEVTAIEAATVDGRETYHVTFEPPRDTADERTITVLVGDTEYVVPLGSGDEAGDEPSDASAEEGAATAGDPGMPPVERIDVWIDRETLFPVKQELATDGAERSWTYANLSFGDDVDDERFEFEPPADAVVEQDVHPVGTPFETVDEAAAAANVSVAEPTALPDDLERADVEAAEYFFEDVSEVTIRYTGDGADAGAGDAADRLLVYAVSSPPRPQEYGEDGRSESVTIGDESATLVDSEFGTQLAWTCEERGYYLFGTEAVEPETVVDAAESIDADCS